MSAIFQLHKGKRLEVHKLDSNKVRSVEKIINSDGITYAINARGQVFSPYKFGNAHYLPGRYRFNNSLLKAFTKLGIISNEDAKLYKEAVKEEGEKQLRNIRLLNLFDALKDLGLKPTRRQLKFLREAEPSFSFHEKRRLKQLNLNSWI